MHQLVLGGIRSGKTALAETLAAEHSEAVTYVATAQAGDEEMAARIMRHQCQRLTHWGLVEEPLALAGVLASPERHDQECLLIDCMSLWVSNLLHAGDATLERETAAFLEAIPNYPGSLIIVSNEVGLGTIAMDRLTRRFCDQLGWLNQALALRCQRVTLSVAGLPVLLKGPSNAQ